MNTEYRYTLEKGSKKYHCPRCGKKRFVRYVDAETGQYLPEKYGRCDRENKCSHHVNPYEDGYAKAIWEQKEGYNKEWKLKRPAPKKKRLDQLKMAYIPTEIFKNSLKGYEANHFIQFLINLFGNEITDELISRYFIASSKHWKGATVFWQIDTQGKIRTGKIMLYNPTTGKRIKEHIHWAHKALKQPKFELEQCLFGEHLLIDTTRPVAIVESEKTAIIASIYLPEFIWLASGGLSFNINRCNVLKERTVILFPDLNGFEKWSNKAEELSQLATVFVS
ncbi:MAG: DUF6371 domain-containing protein, partial [Bacteroidota bacterium]